MQGSKFICLFILLTLIGKLNYAQTITDPPDDRYLEYLVKEKIDSVRKGLSLKPLANDSILYVAAKYHANYLKKSGRLSHYQKNNKGYETPQIRANSFGAPSDYLVGENVALNYYRTPLDNGIIHTNYQDLASDIVEGWVKSKGHYLNIKNSEYDITGVALSFNRIDRSIYIVQKFANVLYQYNFIESKTFFPYSNYTNPSEIVAFDSSTFIMHKGKHAFKTKTPKLDKRHYRTNTYIDLDPKILKIEPKGRNIEVSTSGNQHLAKVIKRRRDGLAIEMVNYDDYTCKNPEYYLAQSRRNYQDVYSGRLLKPKYKKQLRPKIKYNFSSNYKRLRSKSGVLKSFKGAFKSREKKSFVSNLARLPKDFFGYSEFNLIYLNSNEVTRVRHLSGICGKKYTYYKRCVLRDYIYSDTLAYSLPRIDSIYRFYFEKRKSDYEIKDITPLIYSGLDKYIIYEANINAFSSVEGLEEVNSKLQIERAESIAAALQSQQNKKIEPNITTSTNWNLFGQQLATNDSLFFLMDYDVSYQKNWVDSVAKLDEPNLILENLLDSQRYAEIWIRAIYNWKDYRSDLFDTLYTDFIKQYKKQEDPEGINTLLDNKSTRMLALINHHISLGYFTQERIYDFAPPWSKMFPHALTRYLSYLEIYKLKKPHTWKELHTFLNAERKLSPSLVMHNMLVEEFEKVFASGKVEIENTEFLEKTILDLALDTAYYLEVDTFLTRLYFEVLNEKEGYADYAIFKRASSYIFSKYNSKKYSDNEVCGVAKLFVEVERYDLAYQLIEPRIDLVNPHLESITLYTKLSYQNIQEFPETRYGEWLRAIYPLYPKEEWCALFIGPCNISFQVFDDKSVRDLYCRSCSDYKNYVIKLLDGEIKEDE